MLSDYIWFFFLVVRAGVLSDKISSRPAKSSKDFNWFPLAHYEILITRVFKGADKIKKLLGIKNTTTNIIPMKRFKMKVHTAKYDSLCGTELKKGVKYLLSGYVYGGKMRIGLCNWIRPFHELTKTEHRGIRGKFDCSCSTAPCWGGGHEHCPQNNDRCYWGLNGHTEYDSCMLKHGLCLRRNNKCGWVLEEPYKACANSEKSFEKFPMP